MKRKPIAGFVLVVLFLVSVKPAPSEPSSTQYSHSTSIEPPATQWNVTYGGGGIDAAVSVRQTTDSGYVIAGYSDSLGAGGADFWLVRTDADGKMIWNHTYGGGGDDRANCVQQTTDGGFILAGVTNSFGAGSNDFWVVRTDANGRMIWNRAFGGLKNDVGEFVQQTTDGGYVIVGFTRSIGAGGLDFYLVKTDADGRMIWNRTYGGFNDSTPCSVQQTTDGGYVTAGKTFTFGNDNGTADFWVVKTEADGSMMWNKTYGGADNDEAACVRQTTDGGYVVAGFTMSFGAGGADFWLIKVAPESINRSIQRPMEIVEGRTEGDGPLTVDPVACYDVASAELLMNVYDTLIAYDGEHVDKYLPQLAIEWLVKENSPPLHDPETGLDWYYTYYFKVRQGVPFQNSTFGNLTPEDVEYCFERAMVIDFFNGPQWMFYEPLLNGVSHNYANRREVDPVNSVTDRILVGKMIDHAVESNSTHVWFNLAFPGAYPPFMQILCGTWSSIYSKSWAISLGRNNWKGTWGDYKDWTAFTAPDVAPFDDPTPAVMGTGPFKLANLDRDLQYWDANRFIGYWRGWGNGPPPNYGIGWPTIGGSKPAGYVDHFKVTWAYDWPTRSAMFLKGMVDFCAVPRQYINQMVNQPNIRCIYPLQDPDVWVAFYQYDINVTSAYGPIYDCGVIGELGVPRDFFGNATYGVYIRKAFSHCINFTSLISTVFLGEAIQPATALIPTLPYYNSSIPKYDFNLTEAAELFHQWPGLWDTGFTISLPYNTGTGIGAVARKALFEMLATSINSLNTKFHVKTLEVDWNSYSLAGSNRQLPMFIQRWLVDYPDPHDFVAPFYTAWMAGTNPAWTILQGFNDPTMDSLIEQGIRIPDGPARAQVYSQIQQRVIDLCPSIALCTTVHRLFEQAWICGWYYNPMQYDCIYTANIWKWYYTPHAEQETLPHDVANWLPCDVNYDGQVNIIDIAAVGQAFGSSYGPPMHVTWNFRADIDNNRAVNIIDIAAVAKYFTKTSEPWVDP